MVNDPSQQLLKPGEVAKAFRVHVRTVQRWAQNDKLPFILTPGGQRRFRLTDIEDLLKVNGRGQPNTTNS
jgi:excisionase family DNA binding protein